MNPYPRAIFLDRDGTISSDEYGYIRTPEDYTLYPYTASALKVLRQLGFLLFVVTNQSGIARGYFGKENVERVHDHMKMLLAREGVSLDAVYYSPYYKAGIVPPYNIEHEDRKPGIGMFKRARQEFRFRPEHSWMIGDRYSDVKFGIEAGLKTILLLSGNGKSEFQTQLHNWDIRPHYIVSDLSTAAWLIHSLEQ
ncbi:MAG: HAD family hydrolase [Candidatus Cloacimonetes bacterium]|nr:HAD family hydrolase [Candidatus Cloacimonadota bacterium]